MSYNDMLDVAKRIPVDEIIPQVSSKLYQLEQTISSAIDILENCKTISSNFFIRYKQAHELAGEIQEIQFKRVVPVMIAKKEKIFELLELLDKKYQNWGLPSSELAQSNIFKNERKSVFSEEEISGFRSYLPDGTFIKETYQAAKESIFGPNLQDDSEQKDQMVEKSYVQNYGEFLLQENAEDSIFELCDEGLMRVEREKRQEMEHLEGEIRDVNEIFAQCRELISRQGEQVNHLESHIEQSEIYIDDGVYEIEKAEGWANRIRKNKLIVGGLAAIVVVAATSGTIVRYLGKKNKSIPPNDQKPTKK